MYGIASVTKLMTATALMVLHEHGQLDFDRPVNEYLPSDRLSSPVWDPAGATLRRVATHTSGLATYDDFCTVPAPHCQEEMIRRYGVLIWRPGERFDYSNLGYGVLGEVVRGVSKEPYADFMRDSVFRPLGTTHCSVGLPPTLASLAAVPYDEHRGWVTHPRHRAAEGASAAYCSAHDLVRFAMFHLHAHLPDQTAIISDSSINALQSWTVPADGGDRYGFGWWHESRFGYQVTFVGGGTSDAVALLYTIPSEGIAVVVLSNTYDQLASNVVDEILSTLLPPYRESRAKGPEEAAAEPVPPLDSFPTIAGSWSGTVQTDAGARSLALSIAPTGDVRVALDAQPGTALSDAHYRAGKLEGSFAGNLGIDTVDRSRHYTLRLVLLLRGDVFNGGVWTRPIPGYDDGPLHTYWVRLARRPM
jgi:CubicO group peptidase (beta-lactamase class C family)